MLSQIYIFPTWSGQKFHFPETTHLPEIALPESSFGKYYTCKLQQELFVPYCFF